MTFDDEIVLIGTKSDVNDVGDPITIPTRTPVLCSALSVGRSEHYMAAARGLKPEIVFVVNKYDYKNEQEVEYEEKLYNVIRTYKSNENSQSNDRIGDIDKLELVCEGVVNRGASEISNED